MALYFKVACNIPAASASRIRETGRGSGKPLKSWLTSVIARSYYSWKVSTKASRAHEDPLIILFHRLVASLRNSRHGPHRLRHAAESGDHSGEFQRARGRAGRRASSGLFSQIQPGRAACVDAQRTPRPVGLDV